MDGRISMDCQIGWSLGQGRGAVGQAEVEAVVANLSDVSEVYTETGVSVHL
jgi:hypothetical protein